MRIFEDIAERRRVAVNRVRRNGHILNLGWLVCCAAFLMLGQAGIGVGRIAPTFAAIALWAAGQAVIVIGFRHLQSQVAGWEDMAAQNAELQDSIQRVSAWAASTDACVRARNEFLSNASNEIRTPLNSIIGMARLATDTGLATEQKDCMQVINSAAESLLCIVKDVLDYSKIETGRLELEDIDFDLGEVIERVGEIMAPRAAERKIELVCHVDGTIPARLRGDPQRIQQILVNLAANAIKFTPDGEVRIEALLGQQAGGRADLKCRVVDTGIGIEPDKLEAIFHDYAQVTDDTTRRFGGTGLGLSISRRLSELMDGRLTVESRLGHGSTFTLALNLETAASKPPLVVPERFGDRRLLVIDDNASSRRSLRHFLENMGCRPDEADSGRQALAILRHAATTGAPFALALLDLDLPDKSGLEVLREIRQDPRLRDLPVILVSPVDALGRLAGHTDPDWNAYIMKPVKRVTLVSQLAHILGSAPAAAPRVTPPSRGDQMPAQARETGPSAKATEQELTPIQGPPCCIGFPHIPPRLP